MTDPRMVSMARDRISCPAPLFLPVAIRIGRLGGLIHDQCPLGIELVEQVIEFRNLTQI